MREQENLRSNCLVLPKLNIEKITRLQAPVTHEYTRLQASLRCSERCSLTTFNTNTNHISNTNQNQDMFI